MTRSSHGDDLALRRSGAIRATGLVVLALFVLWTVVIPSVNDLLRYSQQTNAGAKHVLHASFDLADEIAKAHGQDSPGVEHERAEIARVRAAPRPVP